MGAGEMQLPPSESSLQATDLIALGMHLGLPDLVTFQPRKGCA